ncbi:hypothetical protein MMC30_003542 [Trapelia coarctata]|nr:hypothetical protein [Trapelia coarctata]
METMPSAVQHSPELKPAEASSSLPKIEEPPPPAVRQFFGWGCDGSSYNQSASFARYASLAQEVDEWALARGFRSRRDLEKALTAYNDSSGKDLLKKLSARKESRRKRSPTVTTTQPSCNDPVPEQKRARKSRCVDHSFLSKSGELPTRTTSAPTTSAPLVALTPKPWKGTHDDLPSRKYRTRSGPTIIEVARYLKDLPKEPKPSKRRGRHGYQPPGHSPLRNAVESELRSDLVNDESGFGDRETTPPSLCEAGHVCVTNDDSPSLDKPISRETQKNQGHKVEPHNLAGVIQYAKPLQFSKLAKPACFGVPGSKYSRVTLRAPDFKAPLAPRHELVKQQLLALPDYQGAHAPTSATLLGLPYLVRLAILERVLVANQTILPFYDEAMINIPKPYRNRHLDHNYDTALLRVNKQLHQEASRVLYIGNTFVLTNPGVAKWWMERIGRNQQLLYAVAIYLITGVAEHEVTWEEHWADFFAWLGPRHHPEVFSVNFENWVELKLMSASNKFGRGKGHTSEITLASAARKRVYVVDLLSKMRGFKEVNLYLGTLCPSMRARICLLLCWRRIG